MQKLKNAHGIYDYTSFSNSKINIKAFASIITIKREMNGQQKHVIKLHQYLQD